jgi:TIGR03009 family protein
MRLSGLALAAALLLAAAATAQQPPPQLSGAPTPPPAVTPAAPADPALDAHLRRWEQEAQKFQTLALGLEQVHKDNAVGVVNQYTGMAYFMKTGTGANARNMVLLETYGKDARGNKVLAEKFVCTGNFFYLFNSQAKEIQAHELPRSAPGAMPDDNFLGMFGLRAEEAKRRYNITFQNEDATYIYIGIKPRFPRDKAEFVEARVVLNKSTFLPVQLWYKQPNNSEVVWSIRSAFVNKPMKQEWFDKPEPPPGWKFVKVAPEADAVPTRTFRNSGTP